MQNPIMVTLETTLRPSMVDAETDLAPNPPAAPLALGARSVIDARRFMGARVACV